MDRTLSGIDRFDGHIIGIGSTSGVRCVIGSWDTSRFGAFADVMVERLDGHRILFAPTDDVAAYVGSTYRFDEVRVGPVQVASQNDLLEVETDDLRLRILLGRRTLLGRLLRSVPTALARQRWWTASLTPVARILAGARTVGSAGNGRREWYCALDQWTVRTVVGLLDGEPIGELARVEPAVRFGFSSTPPSPSMVAVTSWVRTGAV